MCNLGWRWISEWKNDKTSCYLIHSDPDPKAIRHIRYKFDQKCPRCMTLKCQKAFHHWKPIFFLSVIGHNSIPRRAFMMCTSLVKIVIIRLWKMLVTNITLSHSGGIRIVSNWPRLFGTMAAKVLAKKSCSPKKWQSSTKFDWALSRSCRHSIVWDCWRWRKTAVRRPGSLSSYEPETHQTDKKSGCH